MSRGTESDTRCCQQSLGEKLKGDIVAAAIRRRVERRKIFKDLAIERYALDVRARSL
jgi:hypothetical protein